MSENKKLSAAELAAGGLLEAGTATNFHTGSWRSNKPIWNKEKCINCLICWISCPDTSIKIAPDEKKGTVVTGIDYDFCKGCGICAKECPVKVQAITMEIEKK
ncbi:MAG: 4Fe-4S binding protein [Endomicrobia bacterium]|nr:4Fe-4S binding protein [Endomicrobiia bacterium]MCL2506817.1 4Fe-4S binding protein [Endomicrobiia bacterium]